MRHCSARPGVWVKLSLSPSHTWAVANALIKNSISSREHSVILRAGRAHSNTVRASRVVCVCLVDELGGPTDLTSPFPSIVMLRTPS